jgi:hypothetical protein
MCNVVHCTHLLDDVSRAIHFGQSVLDKKKQIKCYVKMKRWVRHNETYFIIFGYRPEEIQPSIVALATYYKTQPTWKLQVNIKYSLHST